VTLEVTVVEVVNIALKTGVAESKTIGDVIRKNDLNIVTYPAGHEDLVQVNDTNLYVGDNTVVATAGDSSAELTVHGVEFSGTGFAFETGTLFAPGDFRMDYDFTVTGLDGTWEIVSPHLNTGLYTGVLTSGGTASGTASFAFTGQSSDIGFRWIPDPQQVDGPIVLGNPVGYVILGLALGVVADQFYPHSRPPQITPNNVVVSTLTADPAHAADYLPAVLTCQQQATIGGVSWFRSAVFDIYRYTENPSLGGTVLNSNSKHTTRIQNNSKHNALHLIEIYNFDTAGQVHMDDTQNSIAGQHISAHASGVDKSLANHPDAVAFAYDISPFVAHHWSPREIFEAASKWD